MNFRALWDCKTCNTAIERGKFAWIKPTNKQTFRNHHKKHLSIFCITLDTSVWKDNSTFKKCVIQLSEFLKAEILFKKLWKQLFVCKNSKNINLIKGAIFCKFVRLSRQMCSSYLLMGKFSDFCQNMQKVYDRRQDMFVMFEWNKPTLVSVI